MSARQPPRTEEESREYTSEPREVVQVGTEEDLPVTGGGHVVQEEEQRHRVGRRWLLIAVLVLALLLLFAPLIMSAVWLTRALSLIGALGWLWIPVVLVILLLGVMTAYYVIRRNI